MVVKLRVNVLQHGGNCKQILGRTKKGSWKGGGARLMPPTF
jgi:hypothetical protein